ncbi:unnamed protein product [Polarella glacialis]|uniref:Methyltransferase small domain-containing protein n=1 Tax=Polarella glacialis TaxID=89957 RepID=A0A813JN39_POLGL|nr:unnamed protein product [Polarella glacialis]
MDDDQAPVQSRDDDAAVRRAFQPLDDGAPGPGVPWRGSQAPRRVREALGALRDILLRHNYSEAAAGGMAPTEPAIAGLRICRPAAPKVGWPEPRHCDSARRLPAQCHHDVVGGALVQELVELNMLWRPAGADGPWLSAVQLAPVAIHTAKGPGALFLAVDWDELRPWHQVMTSTIDSYALLRIQRLAPLGWSPRRVLDLCAGSGVQGLHAAAVFASSAPSVALVDLNPRALRFAKVNVLLNVLPRVTLYHGSLYEALPKKRCRNTGADTGKKSSSSSSMSPRPCSGNQFDLILANPPYVPSMGGGQMFVAGGPQGESITEVVVSGSAAMLAPGGRLMLVANLANVNRDYAGKLLKWWKAGSTAADSPGGPTPNTEVKFDVLHGDVWSPEQYASGFIGADEARSQYRRFLRRAGVSSMTNAFILAHRPEPPPDAERVSVVCQPCGMHWWIAAIVDITRPWPLLQSPWLGLLAKLVNAGPGVVLTLPVATSRKRASSVRQRYGCGDAVAEAALFAARARLSMAGAIDAKPGAGKRTKIALEMGPAMRTAAPVPPLPAPLQPQAGEAASALVPAEVGSGDLHVWMGAGGKQSAKGKAPPQLVAPRLSEVRKSAAESDLDEQEQVQHPKIGRPRALKDVGKAAAELVAEVKAKLGEAIDNAEELAIKHQYESHRIKTLKGRFHCGSSMAADILRITKARLSMAGLPAKSLPNRQVVYLKGADVEVPSALRQRLTRKQRDPVAAARQADQQILCRRQRLRWRAGVLTQHVPAAAAQAQQLPRTQLLAGQASCSSQAAPPRGAQCPPPGATGRRLLRVRRSSQCKEAQSCWRLSRWLRPFKRLRNRLLPLRARRSSKAASPPLQATAAGPKKQVIGMPAVPGWSARLVLFLGGGAHSARPLACTSRKAAWDLLRDSQQISAELRHLFHTFRVANSDSWQLAEQVRLEQLQSMAGVLKALVPLEPRGPQAAVAVSAPGGFQTLAAVPRLLSRAVKRRSSVSSGSSVASRRARRRGLTEATADLERARVLRVDLLLRDLAKHVTSTSRRLDAGRQQV